jgi:hypothetical protein
LRCIPPLAALASRRKIVLGKCALLWSARPRDFAQVIGVGGLADQLADRARHQVCPRMSTSADSGVTIGRGRTSSARRSRNAERWWTNPPGQIAKDKATDHHEEPKVPPTVTAPRSEQNSQQNPPKAEREPARRKHDCFDWISLGVLVLTFIAAALAAFEAGRLADGTDTLISATPSLRFYR